jgi:type II secretory pathway component PulF
VAIVEAGERGGRLEQSFQRLSHHYEELVKFRNRFLLSVAWPLFELVMSIVIIGLLILGWVTDMNNMEPFHWFGVTSWRPWQDFLMYVFLVLLFFGGLATLADSERSAVGSENWPMEIALRIPLIGKTIESSCVIAICLDIIGSRERGHVARRIRCGSPSIRLRITITSGTRSTALGRSRQISSFFQS